jgi:Lsr2
MKRHRRRIMAQKVQIILLSDLALAEDPESQAPAHVTRRFSVDGADFEMDLSGAESEAFDRALAPYREAARLVSRGRGPRGRSARPARAPVDTVRVREWARENDIEVKDRGRVPADVVARYEAAQGS